MFEVECYWKDDKSEFLGIISESFDYKEDDNIFLYGMSEKDIQKEIELGEETENDFIIVKYIKIWNNQ